MRISTDIRDKGYDAYVEMKSRGYQAKVMLDGVEQREVMTVDTDLGYVLKASLPIRAEGGEIVTEELYGNVEIIEVAYKGIF